LRSCGGYLLLRGLRRAATTVRKPAIASHYRSRLPYFAATGRNVGSNDAVNLALVGMQQNGGAMVAAIIHRMLAPLSTGGASKTTPTAGEGGISGHAT
jgi:hypothetical protein